MKTPRQHTDTTPLIEITSLTKSFGTNAVLRGFSLRLLPGENLVILGRSGSGKSVLIKCLIRLIEPDGGDIRIMGQAVTQLDRASLDRLRTEVGFLFQGSALYDSMTVRENLRFPLRRHPERAQGVAEDSLIQTALESVGLAHAIDLLPAELSGGMKRRVALARTLILKPRIILYDEPTTGLDPITANEIIQLMLKLQQELGTASLIITHDMDCARVIANRVIILHDGINYAEGTYSDLARSRDPHVRAFFKDTNSPYHD
ncbi:putative ribonucleotide transport ATP-binding protein mkl [Neolewinella maritima]|uniref:Ribonucleotide transport ATP-binding protein mkl n=1 Tax=Neolewinella maritima TaxID=1383882 RepID=A0ABM9B1I2_9BACT|nr:ATP-binding cassette domain-containing protein [Neolewinella maritima]CAH1000691.1 putative ribonucleotide transport ATP-binding protein mkl [Neolewinella maritima]